MANITDPTAVLFCNTQIRPTADRIVQLYWWAKAVKVLFLANPSLATLLPNDGTATVVDGSAQDGRSAITGADVNTLIANVNAFIVSMEATSSALLNAYTKVAVNIHP